VYALAVNSASICDTYVGTGNGSALVSAVVDATVALALNPANGIAQFFNGQIQGSTNFTGNAAAYAVLRNGLITFFGAALNCTDGSIGPYLGGDLTPFHTPLGIPFVSYFTFNNALLSVLIASKVATSDVIAVATLLDTLRANCCIAADCKSICNKLITPGINNGSAMMGAVVQATVNAAVASPILLPYFNGSIGNHGDFTGARLPTLFQHLVQFFGGALGCSDGTIGNYTGQTLTAAHAGMLINQVAFDTFNGALMGVIATAIPKGSADYNTIYALLNSTNSQVCTTPDCVSYVSTSGSATKSTTGGSTTGGSTTGGSTTGGSTTGGSKSTTGGSTTGGSTTSTTTTTSATPAPTPSSTGFGLVLVAPIFSLLSVFLF